MAGLLLLIESIRLVATVVMGMSACAFVTVTRLPQNGTTRLDGTIHKKSDPVWPDRLDVLRRALF